MQETKLNKLLVLSLGILFVISVILGVVLFFSVQNQKEMEKKLALQEEMIISAESKAKEEDSIIKEADPVITSKQISEELNAIQELVTTEYLYTNAGKYENNNQITLFDRDINIPLTKKSFLLAYDGRIKVGIDLSAVQIQIDEDSRKITVALPKSEITSHEIFEKDIRVYDESDGVFNKITIDNYNEFVSQQKEIMEQKAIDRGVLTSADQEAQTVIKSFLSKLPGMDTYTLVIQ